MKAIVFTVLFVIMSIISGIAEGGGSFNATKLNGWISDTEATTITVDSTAGFLSSSYIVIGNEYIKYTGKDATHFNAGIVRGYMSTEATAHLDDAIVYSGDSSVLNATLGFDVATTTTGIGMLGLAKFTWNFLYKSLPRLLSWDFNYLKIGSMVYLRIFLWALSGAFLISLIPYLLSAVSSLISLFGS